MLGRAPWRLGLGRAGGGGGSKARLTLPTDEDGIGGISPAEALFLAVCAEVCAWLLAPEVPEVGAAQLPAVDRSGVSPAQLARLWICFESSIN